MRLILVRHGESEHVARRIVSAERGCLGLTARGRDQAEALAKQWAVDGMRADVLLHSTAARAGETAHLLQEALGVDTVKPDRDLCELWLGEGDGLPRVEFAKRYGAFDLPTAPDRPICPGGESWNGFLSRVGETLDTLAATYSGQQVVAVTHAGFVVAAFLELFGIPRPGTGARVDPDFTSVTEWEHLPSSKWRLVRLNDTAHLR